MRRASGCSWLAVFLLLISGCATLIGGGGSQEVTFQSAPEDATVYLDGKPIGKTPITTTIKKKGDQTLEFRLDGYVTESIEMKTKVNPWFWGNIILGGLVGSTTDATTGSMYEYEPNQYLITLKKDGQVFLDKDTAAKRFAVVMYTQLISDIDRGGGESLDAFSDLLGFTVNEASLSALRDISHTHFSAPAFAAEAVAFFRS